MAFAQRSDTELLYNYARDGSESAFAELVNRYLPLVYVACTGELGNDPLAEDAAQDVFLLLSRKAPTLSSKVALAGWLFTAARLTAKNVRRSESRRRNQELRVIEAMRADLDHRDSSHSPETSEADLLPLVNDALAALPSQDRDAVLLRFFQEKSFRETGEQIGISEEAAKKRVARAIEKMRVYLLRRGAPVAVAALAALLAPQATRAAVPEYLAAAIVRETIARRTANSSCPGKAFDWRILAAWVGGAGVLFLGCLLLSQGARLRYRRSFLPVASLSGVGTVRETEQNVTLTYLAPSDLTQMLQRKQALMGPNRPPVSIAVPGLERVRLTPHDDRNILQINGDPPVVAATAHMAEFADRLYIGALPTRTQRPERRTP